MDSKWFVGRTNARVKFLILKHQRIIMRKARYILQSGDLEVKDVEMGDPPTIEEVCKVIAGLKKHELERLGGLISVKKVDDPEEQVLFPTIVILNKLHLYNQKFKVNGLTLTPLRVEILLCVLRKNDWMFVSEIHECLKGRIKTTLEGTRKAIKASGMELFLDMDKVRVSSKKSYYRVKPKQDPDTFFYLIEIFSNLGEAERFLSTKYVSENIFRFEKFLEEEMVVMEQETDNLIKDRKRFLSDPAELVGHGYYFNFVEKLEMLRAYWNRTMRLWGIIEHYCERCDRREECTDLKVEKYKSKILSDQIELFKSQKNPGRIVHTYCFTVLCNLKQLLNKISFLRGELESGFWNYKKLDFSDLDEFIVRVLTNPPKD